MTFSSCQTNNVYIFLRLQWPSVFIYCSFSFKILPYSSTDSWKPPIRVSDWLIFCFGNLILHKKKRKWQKHKCYDEKQKKMSKKIIKALNNIFYELAPLTRDVLYSKLQIDGENILVPFCQTNKLLLILSIPLCIPSCTSFQFVKKSLFCDLALII